MSSGFEAAFVKILNRATDKRRETRGRPPRKMDLGDTRSGRSLATGFVEPERVEVPSEFLEPQPFMPRANFGLDLSDNPRLKLKREAL